MLNIRGNKLSHWVSGHLSGTFCVDSMAEFDTIASRIGGSPVQLWIIQILRVSFNPGRAISDKGHVAKQPRPPFSEVDTAKENYSVTNA